MATRTSPAKRTAPGRRTPAAAGTDSTMPFEPIRITKAEPDAAEPGIPLFYLDDQLYEIPRKVPQSMVLEFLRIQRTEGELAGAQRLLERMLGPEAYRALEQSDDVTDEQLEQILRGVIHHVAGPVEPGKGS